MLIWSFVFDDGSNLGLGWYDGLIKFHVVATIGFWMLCLTGVYTTLFSNVGKTDAPLVTRLDAPQTEDVSMRPLWQMDVEATSLTAASPSKWFNEDLSRLTLPLLPRWAGIFAIRKGFLRAMEDFIYTHCLTLRCLTTAACPVTRNQYTVSACRNTVRRINIGNCHEPQVTENKEM